MTSLNKVKIASVVSAVEAANGQYFSVVFYKSDGTIREMNCRTGVKKHLKGGEATYNKADKPGQDVTIGVHDRINKSYKCFKASRVISLTIAGNKINFE